MSIGTKDYGDFKDFSFFYNTFWTSTNGNFMLSSNDDSIIFETYKIYALQLYNFHSYLSNIINFDLQWTLVYAITKSLPSSK